MLNRLLLAGTMVLAVQAAAQVEPPSQVPSRPAQPACPSIDPGVPWPPAPLETVLPEAGKLGDLIVRMERYQALSSRHRLEGLASYYSAFFDGRRTANGEIYRNQRISAAHLTLPLGTWIEVVARKNGRRVRMRVNDRGPYAKKFMLDLSPAAARALGVEVGNRQVEVRIIALPGEEPLPENIDTLLAAARGITGSEMPTSALAVR